MIRTPESVLVKYKTYDNLIRLLKEMLSESGYLVWPVKKPQKIYLLIRKKKHVRHRYSCKD